MHNYSENDAWPAAVQIVDDSDTPNATNLNTPNEGELDRIFYTGKRVLLGGTGPATVTNLAGLTAETGLYNSDLRNVPGYGFYQFVFGSTAVADGLYVVTHASGRWFSLGYHLGTDKRIQTYEGVYNGAALSMTAGTGSSLDPGGRHAGTANGHLILLSSNFTIRDGDEFEISWSADARVGGAVGDLSDIVIGVGLLVSGTMYWPSNANYRAHQSTPDVVNGGTWSGGTNIVVPTCAGIHVTHAHMSMSTRFPWVGGGGIVSGCSFQLVGAQDAASAPVVAVLQGATLSVTQYRTSLG